MPNLTPSPDELLCERISDIETSRVKWNAQDAARKDDATRKQHAFNCAGLRAIEVLRSAAHSGNVQCRNAWPEIAAFLQIVLN